jgi:hypothetical protein
MTQMPVVKPSTELNCALHRIEIAHPSQWLYRLGDGAVIYSETQNRFSGLDAAGLSAYLAFDAGASLADLRMINTGLTHASESCDNLDAIYALSQGSFPADESQWPTVDISTAPDLGTANFEMAGIPIILECPPGQLGDLCRDYFGACRESDLPARFHLAAQKTQGGWSICVNGQVILSVQSDEQRGLGFMHAARSLLYACSNYHVAFHAAMVAHNNCGVMFCALRESGKSTLTAYLVSRGFDLLTDEPALLDLETGCVASLRLPISLKQGSWPVLQECWPHLTAAPVHLRSDGVKIILAHPPAERFSLTPRRLTCIVIPQYCPSSAPEIEAIAPLSLLGELVEGGLLLGRNFGQAKFESLMRLICAIPAYKIRFSALPEIYQMLDRYGCFIDE